MINRAFIKKKNIKEYKDMPKIIPQKRVAKQKKKNYKKGL